MALGSDSHAGPGAAPWPTEVVSIQGRYTDIPNLWPDNFYLFICLLNPGSLACDSTTHRNWKADTTAAAGPGHRDPTMCLPIHLLFSGPPTKQFLKGTHLHLRLSVPEGIQWSTTAAWGSGSHAQGVRAGQAVRPASSLGATTIQRNSTRGITLPNNAQWLLGCHSRPWRPPVAGLGAGMHRHHSMRLTLEIYMGLTLEMCLPLQPRAHVNPLQGTATATATATACTGPLLWDKCHPEDTHCLHKTDNTEQKPIYTDKESLAEQKP